MKTSEILIAAKAKIVDPAHWTQDSYARADNGLPVHPTRPEATCWCSQGALITVTNCSTSRGLRYYHKANYALADAANTMISINNIIDANDQYDHDTVMTIWDLAIQRQQKLEAK